MVDRLGKEIREGFLEEVGLELQGFLCIEDKEMSHQIRNIGQQSATPGEEGYGSQSNQGLLTTNFWMTIGTSPTESQYSVRIVLRLN